MEGEDVLTVPLYYRSRAGRVFRLQRRHEPAGNEGGRYGLCAFDVRRTPPAEQPVAQAWNESSADELREKLRLGHMIRTPEQSFEQLWQRMRMELESLA